MKNLMINLKAKRMHMVQVIKKCLTDQDRTDRPQYIVLSKIPISMNAGFRNTNGLKYSSMYFFSFLNKS